MRVCVTVACNGKRLAVPFADTESQHPPAFHQQPCLFQAHLYWSYQMWIQNLCLVFLLRGAPLGEYGFVVGQSTACVVTFGSCWSLTVIRTQEAMLCVITLGLGVDVRTCPPAVGRSPTASGARM